MSDLAALCWHGNRLGEALQILARHGGLSPRTAGVPEPLPRAAQARGDLLNRWLSSVARGLGIEAAAAEISYADLRQFLPEAGPALLRLPDSGEPRFLALVRGTRRGLYLLGPDLIPRRVSLEVVARCLSGDLEEKHLAETEKLVDEVGLRGNGRERAVTRVLRDQIGGERIGGIWMLTASPGSSFFRQMRSAGLLRRSLVLLGAHLLQYVVWIASWMVIGRAALQGRFDEGWLLAWVLLLLTLIPLRALVTWSQGAIAIGAGGLLKKRLLHGALQLETEEIRHQGAGQFLGRILESEAVESLALSGGFLGMMALIEMAIATVVLALGAGGVLHGLLLVAWVALCVALGVRNFRQRQRWADERLTMTHKTVERMIGHRTRLAQEPPAVRHDDEDQSIVKYLDLSKAMDRSAAALMAIVPRGWLALGLLALAPAFVTGSATPALLAVGLGGVLLANQALEKLAEGVWHLAGAATAWRQVAGLFHAAARERDRNSTGVVSSLDSHDDHHKDQQPILEATDLVFRFRDRRDPVLRGCSLRIEEGDRLLLQGPSGGGKSTLAALLAGLRAPESGLLLSRGLDLQSLGSQEWRRRVVVAPQFHENHVLTETFAFNLLMGGAWPPRPEDLREAEAVCREVGLGELLERMPGGLYQMVGESGWQLSHGERSRLYLARALLQHPDLVVLDESLAALDAETLQRTLDCVLSRARTLLLIAHP